MINPTKAHGIIPSDLLVAGAISAAIDDLRAKPYLLDFCFNWFVNDELTAKYYGAAEKLRAKEWFLKHQIFVTMATRTDDPKFPLISINLANSAEDTATLGDVNYDTTEEFETALVNTQPSVIVAPFTPQSYDPDTGIVTLPDGITTSNVFENQVLVDTTTSTGYTIETVISENQIQIETDLEVNFTNAYIAPIDNFMVASLESCSFKQTYSIKCFAQNEPIYITYLHALVKFILLRYKEELLEGRGFDRTTVYSGGIYLADSLLGTAETTFGQDITLTGYVREVWPGQISQKIQGIKVSGITVIGGPDSSPSMIPEVIQQGWGMENDRKNEDL